MDNQIEPTNIQPIIDDNIPDIEPEQHTYQLPIICSNCGFEDEAFDIAYGTQVGWADCPVCGCKSLRRVE